LFALFPVDVELNPTIRPPALDVVFTQASTENALGASLLICVDPIAFDDPSNADDNFTSPAIAPSEPTDTPDPRVNPEPPAESASTAPEASPIRHKFVAPSASTPVM
jgi:hypothetical protein